MYSPIIPPNKPPLKMGSIMSKFWIGGREQLSSSLWVTKMVSDRAAISSQVVLFPKSIPLTTISQLLERLEDTESEVNCFGSLFHDNSGTVLPQSCSQLPSARQSCFSVSTVVSIRSTVGLYRQATQGP